MPTYRFEAEITISSLHSPGTWLANRDDIYISIEAFNIVKRTRLSEAIFPIIFHERFSFERTFFSAMCPREVCELLEDIPVTIELRQVTDIYLGGTLLAYFDTNARDLFAPCPSLCAKTETDRELLMRRTVDFPGISPRLEFSTYSVIRGYPPYNHACCNDDICCTCCATSHHHCCVPHEPHYSKPTVTSALRSRPKSNFRSREETKKTPNTSPIKSPIKRSASLPRSRSLSRSRSALDVYDRDILEVKELSDKYWRMYRYWQNELERLRTARI